jgi:chaperonin GroES
MPVKIGQTVVYSKYAGTEYEEGGVEYLIVRESDILAIVG